MRSSADVVGQVADDVKRAVGVFVEVDGERIGIDDLDIGRHGSAQRPDQVSIDFDGDDTFGDRSKLPGERSGSGSDFDDSVRA